MRKGWGSIASPWTELTPTVHAGTGRELGGNHPAQATLRRGWTCARFAKLLSVPPWADDWRRFWQFRPRGHLQTCICQFWTWRKSEVKRRWSMKQGRRALQFILHHWWTHVTWKMLKWRQNTKSTKVGLYSAGLTQHSQNKDHQHLKWQPPNHGYHPQVMKMLTNCCKFQNRNVQTFRFVHHGTGGPNHGQVSKTQLFLLNGICMEDYYGKSNLRKSCWNMTGRKFPNWECLFVHREKGLFLSVYVDDIKLAGKKSNLDPMWKLLNKEVYLGEPNIFPGSSILGLYSKTMWNKQRYCGQSQSHVWIANFRGWNSKASILWEFSYFFMILCVGEQDDTTTLQSIYSRHRWPPL